MRRYLILLMLLLCSGLMSNLMSQETSSLHYRAKNLSSVLDTILRMEQAPLRMRDSLMNIHGVDSKEAAKYQKIFEENHAINARKIKEILSDNIWPDPAISGANGNRAICNIIQHVDPATREAYLPLMRQAVLDGKLEPRYLVRSEDRTATDKGELQIYGGQMKYYPETKSFNVWPVYDPENIDKRRAAIGLGPIADWLRMRFDFEWNLEEQIQRTAAFEKERKARKN